MSDTPLLVSRSEGVLWLRLNRPQVRNALNRPLCNALLKAMLEAELDPEVRAIVLTGEGSAFCGGDDIGGLRDGHEGRSGADTVPSDPLDGVTLYTRIASMMVNSSKPVIAGINGAAAGAGLEFACAADLRYASDKARIGSGLVRIAQPGSIALFPRIVGESRATEIYMTGRLVDAQEALRIGLVHDVFPADEFMARLTEVANRIAAGPTKAMGWFKRYREAMRPLDKHGALAMQDRMHMHAAAEIKDVTEGAIAFLEKRAPRFTGQ